MDSAIAHAAVAIINVPRREITTILDSTRSFALSNVQDIYVNSSINSVHVTVHDGSEIIVSFDAPDDDNHIRIAYELNDGILTIIDYRRGAASTRTRLQAGTLNIAIPQTQSFAVDSLDINVANARITIDGQGSALAENITLNAGNGRIQLADFRVSTITARSGNGAITAEYLNVDYDATVSTANGNVTMENSVILGHLSIRLARGNITLNNVDTGTNTLRTIVGRIRNN